MDVAPQNATGSELAETRARLLDAAERLFAEHGFEATSVREITFEAGCNVAAVNYHFGGKEKLYLEVCRRLFSLLREQRIDRIRSDMATAGETATLELFLESFAGAFLEPLVGDGRVTHLMALWDREMQHHRVPPAIFADEVIRPTMEVAVEALERVGLELQPECARRCMVSVVGQLMHVLKVRRMLGEGGLPDLALGEIDDMVRHIVRFSAAGIRACAAQGAS
jgi:AcrR family transcriptional regulator